MGINQDFKNASLNVHRGNWAPALVATIVLLCIEVVSSISGLTLAMLSPTVLAAVSLGSSLFSLFVFLPLEVGYCNALRVQFQSGDNAVCGNMFRIAFSSSYFHYVWSMLLLGLKVVLWSLLLFIPGLVKAFAYAMTPFIIAENPDMRAIDAIRLSQDMMRGHKFDLFYLGLSFIGWSILSVLTLGIGFLWLLPYMTTATVAFYEDIKAEYEVKKIS